MSFTLGLGYAPYQPKSDFRMVEYRGYGVGVVDPWPAQKLEGSGLLAAVCEHRSEDAPRP